MEWRVKKEIFFKAVDHAGLDFNGGNDRMYSGKLCKSHVAYGCCKIFLKKFFPISSIM